MERVFLYNHGGSENHGCEALVRTVISHIPDNTEIELITESPQQDIKYGIHQLAPLKPAIQSVGKFNFDFLNAYLQLKMEKDYIGMDLLPYLRTIRLFDKNQIEVSVGGDIYCYEDYKKFIRLHQRIVKKGCKSILIGCSLEKKLFEDPEFVNDMKSYDLITARESISYQMLKDAGIENVELIPDTAFTLPVEEVDLPEGFMVGNTIGLNISPLVVRKEKKPGIVLENYRQVIRYILKTSDSAIALIPHVVWKSNDDREVLLQLYDEFKDTGRVAMIKDQNCMRLKSFISKCKIFIGARTHATIAAYSTGVPTLVVGYSTKSKGIATDLFGTDENYVIPVDALIVEDDLLKAYQWIEAREYVIRKNLEANISSYIVNVKRISGCLTKIMER